MDASEYLINCLKISKINKNSANNNNSSEEFLEDENENFNKEESNINLIIKLIENIKKEDEIDKALFELSKQRENFKDIAIYLYYSTGTMAILLKEIIEIYSHLYSTELTFELSNRVCNILTLFQCIATHKETRMPFVKSFVPIFIYPFLNANLSTKPIEHLRLTTLGVVGALVKSQCSEVINFLVNTEMVHLSLKIIERGSDLSRTVATFILHRIICDDNGLNYICNTAERFFSIITVISQMITPMTNARLTKHILKCYCRFSEHIKSKNYLISYIPKFFLDKNYVSNLEEYSRKLLNHIMKNLKNSQTISIPPNISDKQHISILKINNIKSLFEDIPFETEIKTTKRVSFDEDKSSNKISSFKQSIIKNQIKPENNIESEIISNFENILKKEKMLKIKEKKKNMSKMEKKESNQNLGLFSKINTNQKINNQTNFINFNQHLLEENIHKSSMSTMASSSFNNSQLNSNPNSCPSSKPNSNNQLGFSNVFIMNYNPNINNANNFTPLQFSHSKISTNGTIKKSQFPINKSNNDFSLHDYIKMGNPNNMDSNNNFFNENNSNFLDFAIDNAFNNQNDQVWGYNYNLESHGGNYGNMNSNLNNPHGNLDFFNNNCNNNINLNYINNTNRNNNTVNNLSNLNISKQNIPNNTINNKFQNFQNNLTKEQDLMIDNFNNMNQDNNFNNFNNPQFSHINDNLSGLGNKNNSFFFGQNNSNAVNNNKIINNNMINNFCQDENDLEFDPNIGLINGRVPMNFVNNPKPVIPKNKNLGMSNSSNSNKNIGSSMITMNQNTKNSHSLKFNQEAFLPNTNFRNLNQNMDQDVRIMQNFKILPNNYDFNMNNSFEDSQQMIFQNNFQMINKDFNNIKIVQEPFINKNIIDVDSFNRNIMENSFSSQQQNNNIGKISTFQKNLIEKNHSEQNINNFDKQISNVNFNECFNGNNIVNFNNIFLNSIEKENSNNKNLISNKKNCSQSQINNLKSKINNNFDFNSVYYLGESNNKNQKQKFDFKDVI